MDQEASQTPEASKPEPQVSPRHGLSLSWLVWPFMGIFFYVLSIGPVARVSDAYDFPKNHPRMESACEVIYAPVIALADNSGPATRFLLWYLRLWHVPVGKQPVPICGPSKRLVLIPIPRHRVTFAGAFARVADGGAERGRPPVAYGKCARLPQGPAAPWYRGPGNLALSVIGLTGSVRGEGSLPNLYLAVTILRTCKMHKTRVILIAALLAFALLFYLWIKAEQSRAYAFRLLCWSIATDLLTNTNSERVALIDHWSSTNFSAFLAVPVGIESVKLGDEPRGLLNFRKILDFKSHADARLYLTNQSHKHFQIFIRDVKSPTNYIVIGTGWD